MSAQDLAEFVHRGEAGGENGWLTNEASKYMQRFPGASEPIEILWPPPEVTVWARVAEASRMRADARELFGSFHTPTSEFARVNGVSRLLHSPSEVQHRLIHDCDNGVCERGLGAGSPVVVAQSGSTSIPIVEDVRPTLRGSSSSFASPRATPSAPPPPFTPSPPPAPFPPHDSPLRLDDMSTTYDSNTKTTTVKPTTEGYYFIDTKDAITVDSDVQHLKREGDLDDCIEECNHETGCNAVLYAYFENRDQGAVCYDYHACYYYSCGSLGNACSMNNLNPPDAMDGDIKLGGGLFSCKATIARHGQYVKYVPLVDKTPPAPASPPALPPPPPPEPAFSTGVGARYNLVIYDDALLNYTRDWKYEFLQRTRLPGQQDMWGWTAVYNVENSWLRELTDDTAGDARYRLLGDPTTLFTYTSEGGKFLDPFPTSYLGQEFDCDTYRGDPEAIAHGEGPASLDVVVDTERGTAHRRIAEDATRLVSDHHRRALLREEAATIPIDARHRRNTTAGDCATHDDCYAPSAVCENSLASLTLSTLPAVFCAACSKLDAFSVAVPRRYCDPVDGRCRCGTIVEEPRVERPDGDDDNDADERAANDAKMKMMDALTAGEYVQARDCIDRRAWAMRVGLALDLPTFPVDVAYNWRRPFAFHLYDEERVMVDEHEMITACRALRTTMSEYERGRSPWTLAWEERDALWPLDWNDGVSEIFRDGTDYVDLTRTPDSLRHRLGRCGERSSATELVLTMRRLREDRRTIWLVEVAGAYTNYYEAFDELRSVDGRTTREEIVQVFDSCHSRTMLNYIPAVVFTAAVAAAALWILTIGAAFAILAVGVISSIRDYLLYAITLDIGFDMMFTVDAKFENQAE
eukprot:gene22935-27732_t